MPTSYNGIVLPEICYGDAMEEEHFFVIGDWGGVIEEKGEPPKPADNRGPGSVYRHFVHGVDDCAQQRVAAQMRKAANVSRPRYVINAGDNFYWAGIEDTCGSTECCDSTGQFKHIFEEIYTGPELDDKPWLGVLGNHDYGGWMFTRAWDQTIAYSWGPAGRWITPALYWAQRMRYADFVVDYFFVDSNVNDAMAPDSDPEHNMCSQLHNPKDNASCGTDGPQSVADCTMWFLQLWEKQVKWLERQLAASDADWKIVVTHFPPEWQKATWTSLWKAYGIDLIITGHRHDQEVVAEGPELPAYIVAGGGGGVTSEGPPDLAGHDDQYGFMDVTISRDEIKIEAISHGGIVRSTTRVSPRHPRPAGTERAAEREAPRGRAPAADDAETSSGTAKKDSPSSPGAREGRTAEPEAHRRNASATSNATAGRDAAPARNTTATAGSGAAPARNTAATTTTLIPLPPPTFPEPSPLDFNGGSKYKEKPLCVAGDMVMCPGTETRCVGDQCCPDGTTCPSAFPDYGACVKKKSFDCTTAYATPPAGEPQPPVPSIGEGPYGMIHALSGGILRKFRPPQGAAADGGGSRRRAPWVVGATLAAALATAGVGTAVVRLRTLRNYGSYRHLEARGLLAAAEPGGTEAGEAVRP